MGDVSRDSLRGFLAGQIQDAGLISRLMDLLEPLFRWAESGAYELAPETELDPEQVRTAIAKATDQEVVRVVLVSRSRPFPKPPWMTAEAYQNHPWISLWRNLWAGLRDSLDCTIPIDMAGSFKTWDEITPDRGLRGDLFVRFRDSLWMSLWDSLKNSLRESSALGAEDNPLNRLGDTLGYILFGCLHYFLILAVTSRTEKLERLIPLIKLLPKVLPLGVKKDEPGVWIVLAA